MAGAQRHGSVYSLLYAVPWSRKGCSRGNFINLAFPATISIHASTRYEKLLWTGSTAMHTFLIALWSYSVVGAVGGKPRKLLRSPTAETFPNPRLQNTSKPSSWVGTGVAYLWPSWDVRAFPLTSPFAWTNIGCFACARLCPPVLWSTGTDRLGLS